MAPISTGSTSTQRYRGGYRGENIDLLSENGSASVASDRTLKKSNVAKKKVRLLSDDKNPYIQGEEVLLDHVIAAVRGVKVDDGSISRESLQRSIDNDGFASSMCIGVAIARTREYRLEILSN